MLIRRAVNLFKLTPEQGHFLRKHVATVAFWPSTCIIVALLMMMLLVSLYQSARQHHEAQAQTAARQLSEVYAQQIARAVGEIDHITALLRSNWEQSSGRFRLDQIRARDSFIDMRLAAVTLIDRDGIIVSSTMPGAVGMSVTDRAYFRFHRVNAAPDMLIGVPLPGRIMDKEIITFTRRLATASGEFDGVICASVGTPFMTSFANASTLGQRGMLAILGADGITRSAKIGNRVDSLLEPEVIPRLGTKLLAPTTSPADPGLFLDHDARFIAGTAVPQYPLHAVVGLSLADVALTLEATRSSYIGIAAAGCVVLLLFAIAATVMAVRIAWRKHREEVIRNTYRIATEGANEGFYMWGPVYGRNGEVLDYELVDCNAKGAELYGRQRSDILGVRLRSLYKGELLDELLALVPKIMETGFHDDEFRTNAGSVATPEWISRRFVRAADGIAVTLRDISERKRMEQETARLAEHDALTGLPNRHWLAGYLPLALARAAEGSRALAVLFVDLDGFKNINDSLGHGAGDTLLHAAARRIRGVLRPADSVARFGGDEFVIVIEGLVSDDDAAEVATRVSHSVSQPFEILGRQCKIGASIGISLYPRDGADAETLIRNADIGMYSAKSEAKGQHRFFSADLYRQLQHRLDTERELAAAIEEDQFIVHYQPRVNTHSGELVGMEALVRWQHPEKGLLYPGAFIDIAEASNLIVQLGEVVMDKVCAQLAQWQAEGRALVPVSVNASARQFDEGRVKDLCIRALRRHGIDARYIEIELTESIMANNAQQVFEELRSLHEIGVPVHLDDFGTGYSSLAALHKLDVDVLKVDRAFTAQLGAAQEGEVFFSAIVSMARALGMRVIAEGVETPQQLAVLQRLGCDEVQGYLVSRPLPAAEVVRFYGQRTLPALA
ncbi:bifunctional diguanylate cyclase/phosphodiesterase [Noviherbaspirillum pedocola]|uniref:EAL domain-containing protein n=1 Tax=Noviherbaspirillum pedocola TaxID=2801341 RepID=A0A934W8Z8_9BURK|nr:EAL domain-containing protein [Noviherbaspirillum pedocola]MBK4738175.1 EAL domain-containing protein [Noviherbaspirillum pedocola]